MRREDIFDCWMGKDHPWVAWVKPSLFDGITDLSAKENDSVARKPQAPPWLDIDASWVTENTAVIVDLPAEEGLVLALALAQRGIRPVLGINACSAPGEVIDMRAVRELLSFGARYARAFPTGMTVRPAFILDARRDGSGCATLPGMFDNRWALFTSDLPSIETLRTAGITRVVVVRDDQHMLSDLETILLAYQAGGLELQLRDAKRNHVTTLSLSERNWLSRFFGSVLRRFAYRRRWDGSFGRTIPEEPSHG